MGMLIRLLLIIIKACNPFAPRLSMTWSQAISEANSIQESNPARRSRSD
jgi:hypothetical protein